MCSIPSLDVLRGFALLGMIVVHFHGDSTDPGGIDDIVRVFVWRLIESKSHGTFALLFGAGFAIQLRRAEAQRRPFAAVYLRRLLVLALFGFAAHAFFGYNVLLGYAVWAVPLLVIRRWSTRALLVAAVLSAASVPLYRLAADEYRRLAAGPEAVAEAARAQQARTDAVNGAEITAGKQGRYAVLLAARLRHMAWFYTQPFFIMPSVTLTLLDRDAGSAVLGLRPECPGSPARRRPACGVGVLCRPHRLQHRLAETLSVRPCGVAVAVAHLWAMATDAASRLETVQRSHGQLVPAPCVDG